MQDSSTVWRAGTGQTPHSHNAVANRPRQIRALCDGLSGAQRSLALACAITLSAALRGPRRRPWKAVLNVLTKQMTSRAGRLRCQTRLTSDGPSMIACVCLLSKTTRGWRPW